MMRKDTLKITTGAMFIAIFAILLLINRQTGGLLEELVMYILPIPMVAYSAKYGWKTSIPVLIAMGLISVLVGTPLTIFYALTEAIIGLVLGTCIYKKLDMTKALFAVMILSSAANVLNTIVLASLFGYNVADEVTEMQNLMSASMDKAMSMAGGGANAEQAAMMQQMMDQMLDPAFLMRMMVISMVIFGLVQGYLVYQLSLLILRRLRFVVPRPKTLTNYHPARWTGFLGMFCMLTYMYTNGLVTDPTKQAVIQTAGIIGYLYLICFGAIVVYRCFSTVVTRSRAIGGIAAFAALLLFGQPVCFLGFAYIVWPQLLFKEDVVGR